jgi:hypothetical protein
LIGIRQYLVALAKEAQVGPGDGAGLVGQLIDLACPRQHGNQARFTPPPAIA